jgi:hypothetical protein
MIIRPPPSVKKKTFSSFFFFFPPAFYFLFSDNTGPLAHEVELQNIGSDLLAGCRPSFQPTGCCYCVTVGYVEASVKRTPAMQRSPTKRQGIFEVLCKWVAAVHWGCLNALLQYMQTDFFIKSLFKTALFCHFPYIQNCNPISTFADTRTK